MLSCRAFRNAGGEFFARASKESKLEHKAIFHEQDLFLRKQQSRDQPQYLLEPWMPSKQRISRKIELTEVPDLDIDSEIDDLLHINLQAPQMRVNYWHLLCIQDCITSIIVYNEIVVFEPLQ